MASKAAAVCSLLLASLSVVNAVSHSDVQSDLTRLAYINDAIYVGGQDRLYKLDKDNLQVLHSTTLSTNISCGDEPCSRSPNAHGWVHYLSQYGSGHAILCSSLHGHCEIRALGDLSLNSSSEGYIVTNDRNGGVVATVAPFINNGIAETSIWIASSYFSVPSSSSSSYALAARNHTLGLTIKKERINVFTKGYSSSKTYANSPGANIGALKYVYSFANDQFRFFVKRRAHDSSIAGVCNNDKKFSTLVEIPLACRTSGGDIRPVIQAAYSSTVGLNLRNSLDNNANISLDDTLLYAAFGSSNASERLELCVFSAQEIINKIQQAFLACHKDGDNTLVKYGPVELTGPSSSECLSVSMTLRLHV